MSGQAQEAPSYDDVASFLVENPSADTDEDATPGSESALAVISDAENPDDESGASPDTDDDASGDAGDDEANPTPDQLSGKFKVTVKGEDGADSTLEVDSKELIAGYQRHADYTRKTMELGERERQAHEVVTQRLTEGHDHYQQKAATALAAIQTLAGLKSDTELADLAVRDRDLYIQERARADAVRSVMAQVEQGMQHERQQQALRQQQVDQAAFSRAWGVLGQQGIDKTQLQTIFARIQKDYGVPESRFAKLSDPALVFIMRDAMRYRDLQEKTKAVKAKAINAPKLPAGRQSVPKSTQVNTRLNARFKSGRAKTNDLASWLLNNA